MKDTLKMVKTAALLVAGLWFALPATTLAQERYISDVLRVPLRSGMGNEYRIVHRGLSSGTQLELLQTQTDEDNEVWAKVRTDSGQQGWIRQQYLLEEPTAKIKLSRLQSKMDQLGGDQKQLLNANEQLQTQNTELESQLTEVREQYQQLQNEHAELTKLSANSIQLNEQYQSLNEKYQLLQTRTEVLKTENERLERQSRYNEWLFGAGLLVAGVILSWVLQAIGRRKRRSEWG